MRTWRVVVGSLNENGLRASIAELCIWLGIIHAALGVVILLDPSLFSEPIVYEWVGSLLPFTIWGMLFVGVGVTLIWAGKTSKSTLARVGLTGYVLLQWLWAISFLYFTIEYNKITGLINFIQWVTGPVIVFFVLRRSFFVCAVDE